MEDMISKIIDMDKQARDMTNAARQSKLDHEKEIIRTKEKIKNDYLERANERIRINTQALQKKADEKLAVIEKKNEEIIRKMNEAFDANKAKWVDEIVSRTIG